MAGDGGAVEQVKLSFSEEDDPQSSFFYLDRIHSAQEHDDIITGNFSLGAFNNYVGRILPFFDPPPPPSWTVFIP